MPPGLRMHTNPRSAKAAMWCGHHCAHVSQQANGRIPVVAVTGTNGKTTTVRLISHILKTAGQRVGMTDTNGVHQWPPD